MRRLWLADQQLRCGVGHHAGYNRCIADAALASGCEPVIASHCRFNAEILAPHRVERMFRTDWRANPPRWTTASPGALRLLETISEKRFRADLRCLDSLIAADDLVFAQMIAPRHFRAWINWITTSERPPSLVLQLGYQPQRFRGREFVGKLSSLPDRVRRRIFLVTDSEKMVEPFVAALRTKISYLPHVVDFCAVQRQREPKASLVFFVPGNARREKGFADILAALGKVDDLLSEQRLRIRIQCHEPDQTCREILVRRPVHQGVEWLEQSLDGSRYAEAFAACDAVLLPYHLDHYSDRGSGIFCEARVSGKPVIASRGTWAGDRVAREGGGWLCEERDPESLAMALRNALGTWQTVNDKAAALTKAAQEEFSPTRFIEKIFLFTGHACS